VANSRTVRIVAAAIVLVVLAALAIPLLVPIDSYRPLLVWAVESATGRNVQIDALRLSFLPTVHITVVNFRMQNPPGFPAGDALVASSIDLGIAPQALLSRRLDITYIAPSGVQLNVLRDAAGQTNFATTAPTTAPAQRPAPVFTLDRVGPVSVNDAAITFADVLGKKLPAPAFSLRGVSGTIGSIDARAPDWVKKLAIVANLRGAQLTLPNLTKPVEFDSGELTISGGAARGTFSLSVGTIKLAGAAAFARLDPLSITFAVTGPELDFNTLATFLDGAQGSATTLAAGRLLAHGTVAIGKVIFAPLEASQLKGQLDLYAGAVRLNAWTLSAYGGTVRGNAELNGSAGSPVAATAQAHGLNVRAVLAAAGAGTTGVTGTLETAFRLTTSLARDPERSLLTTGTFAVRNGSLPSSAFKGLNLPPGGTRFSYFGGDLHVARERGYSDQLTLIGPEMQATMQGSFGFDRTLQYSGTGVLDSLTQGTSLAGSPLLASVEPLLENALQKNAGAARVSVPFTLRGTLDHPQFALAGTPQLVPIQSTGHAVQQPAKTPSLQNLINQIPGL
jgi:hypothetical protein